MPLDAALAIVNEDGTMTDAYRDFMLKVDKYLPIEGDGSPEGVVEAPLYSLYIDRTATVAPIEYRKMLASISSDRKQGWKAV